MKIEKGQVWPTKQGYIEILEYVSAVRVKVKFLDEFGFIKFCTTANIKKGAVENLFLRKTFGVGYFGEGIYKAKIDGVQTKEYICWSNMMKRCYDAYHINYKRPTYRNTLVCADWHNFQNFAAWYTSKTKNIVGWELDKDILVSGNKIYGPDTCVMLPPEINSLFDTSDKSKTGLPKAVSRASTTSKFYVTHCKQYTGGFDSLEEAYKFYANCKSIKIVELIEKYSDLLEDRAKQALYKINDYYISEGKK